MQVFSPERPSGDHHIDENDHTAEAAAAAAAGYSRSTIQHATNNNTMGGTGNDNMKTFTLMELKV
jgi:hypothetical protein